MKIFKRNQLIILVISLMLITAGYLNFTQNTSNVQTSTIASRDDLTIGDAELVSASINGETNKLIEENIETGITEEQNNVENILQENETIETVSKQDDYYFETSKLERNTMYSELLETYQEIYNNNNSNNEQKQDAINKITKLNNTKNAIMISENLILAKGFENAVIFVNDDSISVIVKIAELKEEQVAQIQNIISRELKVSAELVHISSK